MKIIILESRGNRWERWLSWARRNLPEDYAEFQKNLHLGIKAYETLYKKVLEELRKRKPDLRIEEHGSLEGFTVYPAHSRTQHFFYKDPRRILSLNFNNNFGDADTSNI